MTRQYDEWMPGDPMPTKAPPEPPGQFKINMHTRKTNMYTRKTNMHTRKTIATQVNAGLAPGIDPGRIRLYRDAKPYEECVASITPESARNLAACLRILADVVDGEGI